jgi:outer membrane protein OmpA-like peptidoglycan-associated protein
VPGQGRLGDKANVPADAHGCPACPHPGTGPAITGSTDVFVNSRPAVRVDDQGIHAACCNTNMWTANQGSATVFINNKAAHRLGDKTKHCGGSGNLIEGSDNVMVGGASTGGGGGGAGGGSSSAQAGGGTQGSGGSADGINSNQTGSGGGGAGGGGAGGGGAGGGGSETPAPADQPLPPGEPPTHPDDKWFELKLVDEVGDPIGGVELKFTYGGKTKVVPTGGDGVAHVDDPNATTAEVVVVDRTKLREALKPRWSKGRAPKTPSGHGVSVQPLDEQLEPVALKAAFQSTLAITPFFMCSEIPGAHFAFARSFPTSDAIQTLSEIAQEMHAEDENGAPLERKALVFGHTDLSGSDELNKELSERRAKAIYALFTHDDKKWEELYSGKPSGKHWQEKWDVWEAQHMMNALSCGDAAGNPLKETGIRDKPTKEAIRRFQRGDYPDKPAEQAPLPESDFLGEPGRKEMFFAYAKRVTRKPVPKDRFVEANGTPYVGCGEFNPLSKSAKDAESRRAVIMIFDGAAGPANPLPCKSNSVAPCREVCSPPNSPAIDPAKPYRCSVYKEIATKCPCAGGPDLSHDLVVRLMLPEKRANTLPNKLVLESDDGTVVRELALASDVRATDEHISELHFENVPDWHDYRLRSTGGDPAHVIFDYTPFDKLHELPPDDPVAEQTQGMLDADEPGKTEGTS